MAGGKQTPRQKLIGLMYLVFLALMALQVSREVLDSVVLIDREIQKTNINLNQRINSTLRAFESQLTVDEERVRPFYEQALEAQRLADELVDFILRERAEMIAELDRIDVETAMQIDLIELRNKENYTNSTRFWLTTDDVTAVTGGPGSRAYNLRQRISEFKDRLMPILEANNLVGRVNLGLDVDMMYPAPGGIGQIDWQRNMFDRVIPVAVATNLTRLVAEVRGAEFDLISNLFSRIAAGAFTFDEVRASIVPVSTIVMQGGFFEADVFIAAIDNTQQPVITWQGGSIPVVDGVGKLRIPATSPGSRTFSGNISLPDPDGGAPRNYPFEGQFIVQPPSATVSATKMNVVYIGLDNPLSISAPGVPTENLRASATGGTLTALGGGNFNLVPAAGSREAVITIRAVDGTSTRSMGSQTFRVRPIPPPVAFIAGRREGRITREELALAGSIIPRLEGFEFDFSFQIASFIMLANIGGDVRRFVAQGNRFTPDMIQAINNATRGQVITFMEILTRPGPDGRTLNLGSISFNII